MNHLQSAKFEQKLYNQVKEKMDAMQEMNMSWIEVGEAKKTNISSTKDNKILSHYWYMGFVWVVFMIGGERRVFFVS